MTFQQIVGMGKYEYKMHNNDNGNASFGENYIMMIGSDVKTN